ncbi:hypothetical protein [Chitinophaga sp. OAE865]|uniref:hypothetical protein n=1 Tax=Chitinophaga sp. OAE865 TaxID=2817898 RepID=UPI001AE26E46
MIPIFLKSAKRFIFSSLKGIKKGRSAGNERPLLYATGSLHYRTSRVNDIDALIINFLLLLIMLLFAKRTGSMGEANKKASSDEEAHEKISGVIY